MLDLYRHIEQQKGLKIRALPFGSKSEVQSFWVDDTRIKEKMLEKSAKIMKRQTEDDSHKKKSKKIKS